MSSDVLEIGSYLVFPSCDVFYMKKKTIMEKNGHISFFHQNIKVFMIFVVGILTSLVLLCIISQLLPWLDTLVSI